MPSLQGAIRFFQSIIQAHTRCMSMSTSSNSTTLWKINVFEEPLKYTSGPVDYGKQHIHTNWLMKRGAYLRIFIEGPVFSIIYWRGTTSLKLHLDLLILFLIYVQGRNTDMYVPW